jgi:prolyl-tRNA synthetase
MRMSQLFSRTFREAPAEVEIESHKLLIRAGYIQQLGSGIYSLLPLGWLAIAKIEGILRREMASLGAQEVKMPVVHPAEIWKKTGRWDDIDAEMGRFKDRANRDMALAMTHEEVVADLVKSQIDSYRQLPALIYQIQTKWRDDPRPRAGLIRLREFTMKDSYSLDADWDGLDAQYQAHYDAYFRIFKACGLNAIAVESDVGMMGGQQAHEYMYLTPIGEDTIIICDSCGYAANRQAAKFKKPEPIQEEPKVLEEVATPDCKTIDELAEFLNIDQSQTAKCVFYSADVKKNDEVQQQLVIALVRGDMDVNETKLSNAVGALRLIPATEDQIRAVGAEPGYATPAGTTNSFVVVDDLIQNSVNLATGANEFGYHNINVNYGRDFEANVISDIAAADEGHSCFECGNRLRISRGVELGNIFKLGTRYSEALDCTFRDQDGSEKPVIMGSYGIGLERLLACIAQEHHDENGLIWPASVAPFHIHFVGLNLEVDEIQSQARELFNNLLVKNLTVLFDDRNESPGVKFKDADLIGIPWRITLSKRSLDSGGIELKRRGEKETQIIASENIVEFLVNKILDE